MLRKTNRFILLVFLGDALVLYGAFLAAFALRMRGLYPLQPPHTLEAYIPAVAVTIGICLLMFLIYGLYDLPRQLSMIEEYGRIIKAVSLALVIALTLTFFFKYYERSRLLVLLFWLTAMAGEVAFRWLMARWIKAKRRAGWNNLNVLILGVDTKRLRAAQVLNSHPELGYRVVGNLLLHPDRDLAKVGEGQVSDGLAKKIAEVMVKSRLDGVILTLPIKYYEQMLGIAAWCGEKELEVHYVTSNVDLLLAQAIQDELRENSLGSVPETTSFWQEWIKRLLDELLSLLVLLITAPVWIAAAVAIKLDSPGPVFFRQERVGRYGRHFTIYKFRTMHITAPAYANTPRQKHDPRVTRVGALLRSTSLDELPQLINVIKGDMSLVGPRPEQPFLVKKYNRAIYHRRHLVLPGLTGLWQVSGRSDKPLEENVKYDLYYIRHRSLLFDLILLLRTIPAVLSKKGAY